MNNEKRELEMKELSNEFFEIQKLILEDYAKNKDKISLEDWISKTLKHYIPESTESEILNASKVILNEMDVLENKRADLNKARREKKSIKRWLEDDLMSNSNNTKEDVDNYLNTVQETIGLTNTNIISDRIDKIINEEPEELKNSILHYGKEQLFSYLGKNDIMNFAKTDQLSEGIDIAKKIINTDNNIISNIIEEEITDGLDKGVKSALATGIEVVASKGILGATAKAAIKSNVAANIAYVAVESIKSIVKYNDGQITGTELATEMAETAATVAATVASGKIGAAAGAQVGLIFGPIGSTIGAATGAVIGAVSSTKIGKKLVDAGKKIYKKVSNTVKEYGKKALNAVKEKATSVVKTAVSVAKSAWNWIFG